MREQWGSRTGFVLAAMGSAIGLGNIWRFPAEAYSNGGGAFLLPYLIAMITTGIPILIMLFIIGHKYGGSAPLSFSRISKKAEWLGWWQLFVAFVISTYYSVIIAWALSFAVFSFNLNWGSDTEAFFQEQYAGFATVEPGQFGGFVWQVFVPLVIIWAVVLFILFKGVRKGIERANKIFIPVLVILMIFIVIRAVTLDGAGAGLDSFFKPDWGSITDGSVWVAAYGQIFFSLSIAFGIMIAYSSYLPKKTDLTNNAFIVGLSNSGFEFLVGIGIFAALGFMANTHGVGVSEVAEGGPGLVFVVIPEVINQMPALSNLFGVVFFLSVIFAGMSSLISIVEAYVSGMQDKFQISRGKAVAIGGGLSAIISILYSLKGGMYYLDVVDNFINSYGVVLCGLVAVVIVAWFTNKLGEFQDHANAISDIRLGLWWKICLWVITPGMLIYMMIDNIMGDISESYEGYGAFNLVGVITAAAAVVIGLIFAGLKWKHSKDQKEEAN